jgi:hypothetical protein
MRLAVEWKAEKKIRLSPVNRKRKKRLARYAKQDLANKQSAETENKLTLPKHKK